MFHIYFKESDYFINVYLEDNKKKPPHKEVVLKYQFKKLTLIIIPTISRRKKRSLTSSEVRIKKNFIF